MKDSPRGWGKLFAKTCKAFNMRQLRSDECVFVYTISNINGQIQNIDLGTLHRLQPNVPEHKRVYKDYPYDFCILIVCSYVDDNLAFTNSRLIGDSFSVYCNKNMTMTCDGEVHWYLSVKYDRDHTTGAVTASQELYINKILKRWGMEICNPLPTPFPAKADAIIDELSTPIDNPDPHDIKQFQELVGQLLYCQQNTVPEISWVVSFRTAKHHITPAKCMAILMPASPTSSLIASLAWATSSLSIMAVQSS